MVININTFQKHHCKNMFIEKTCFGYFKPVSNVTKQINMVYNVK